MAVQIQRRDLAELSKGADQQVSDVMRLVQQQQDAKLK
jgi:hypothetical protein